MLEPSKSMDLEGFSPKSQNASTFSDVAIGVSPAPDGIFTTYCRENLFSPSTIKIYEKNI